MAPSSETSSSRFGLSARGLHSDTLRPALPRTQDPHSYSLPSPSSPLMILAPSIAVATSGDIVPESKKSAQASLSISSPVSGIPSPTSVSSAALRNDHRLASTPPSSPQLASSSTHPIISTVNVKDIESRDNSASTPPPSPPFSAVNNRSFLAHHRQENDCALQDHQGDKDPELQHDGFCYSSIPQGVTAAAAAAAAASYTSQELAIAYSMVASTQQQWPLQEPQQTQDTSPSLAKVNESRPNRDGTDALSSLLKRTIPLQEPYFLTRHAITSQHTLSTMGGVLFSLDEDPKEFNQDMYVAMRNRIFELEAKTVNYAPFNRSRKRSVDRSADEYHGYHGYGRECGHGDAYSHRYETETGHHLKKSMYRHRPHHHLQTPPAQASRPIAMDGVHVNRSTHSCPSWCAPETYMYELHHDFPSRGRYSRAVNREWDQQRTSKIKVSPYVDLHPFSPPSSNGTAVHAASQIRPQSSTRPYPAQHVLPAIQPRPIHPSKPESALHATHRVHTPQTISVSTVSHPLPPHIHPLNPDHQSPQMTQANATVLQQQRQSFHQRQHRAQQQAQSDYSRSYHLRKHLRMLDQQRDAQISRQKQHQEQQKEQQQQQEKQKQSVTIQRHYQPHQQMYPYHSTLRPLPILSRSVPHLPQSDPNARSSALHQQHQEKQQLIQRYQLHFDYQKQRELCQPQHQHLQKTTGQFSPSWAVIESPLSSPQETTTSEPHVTRMISRSIGTKASRPLECFNCMALDTLTWRPKAESPKGTNAALASTSSARFTLGDGPNLPTGASSVSNGEVLCSACIQYMQSYGKSRPVPPFRLNFMRKVHCRFKKELLQLRFQGWQDTQILEIDDRMTEREFRTLFFAGMEEGLAITSSAQSGEPSSPKLSSNSILEQNGASVATNIQDDDDDDDRTFDSLSTDELRTFTSEASLGDLFGHRWKMEPIVGYTLVHFGGSDRTRMVPMNPTVSSLTVTYIRKLESVKFSFRVHVNGLCLLSSGGGPPALHMPEMADEEDSEDDQEAHEALEITEDQYDKLDTRQERDL